MNGLTAAKGLRRSVEQAGGSMRISVGALGDAFGRGRLTTRALTGMEGVLRRAGLEAVPGLREPGDGWITLRVATTPPFADAPPPSTGAPGTSVLGAVAAEVRALPRPHVPASLAAALALLIPVAVAGAVVGGDGNPKPRPADTRASLLDGADTALLAGDYKGAIALTTRADPRQVPALRARVVSSLLHQARTAQHGGAYVRAIRLSRRAARFGSAPGATRIVVQSRAGLDLRRAAQRRALRAPRTTG